MLHSSEVESQILEPLTNMYNNFQTALKNIELAKPSHMQSKKMRKYVFDHKVHALMRDKYSPFDLNCTEPCPLPETFMEKGITANLPIMAGAVLKAVQQDGTLHLRPLCTTGDLLLAINQLLDSEVFRTGLVQLPDPHKVSYATQHIYYMLLVVYDERAGVSISESFNRIYDKFSTTREFLLGISLFSLSCLLLCLNATLFSLLSSGVSSVTGLSWGLD